VSGKELVAGIIDFLSAAGAEVEMQKKLEFLFQFESVLQEQVKLSKIAVSNQPAILSFSDPAVVGTSSDLTGIKGCFPRAAKLSAIRAGRPQSLHSTSVIGRSRVCCVARSSSRREKLAARRAR
jgi:hypothetical protein